jgi:DNA invertase Pin-like site-specific DNA recombinase
MLVEYARTSTLDQVAGLEAHERDLATAGCEKIFVEQASSVDVRAREKLAEGVSFVREGGHPNGDQAGPLCGPSDGGLGCLE